MKRIVMTLMTTLLLVNLTQGSVRTEVERDANGNKKRIIELRDTIKDGKHVTDTLYIITYSISDSEYEAGNSGKREAQTFNFNKIGEEIADEIISIIAIIAIFGMPVFIILIVLHYRNKNRQAKYRLAEKAIASGQPLPAEYFQQVKPESTLNKGIKNIFLGIGLFVFLYAITGDTGLACVGALIMFTGFGQVVIYYANCREEKKNKHNEQQ